MGPGRVVFRRMPGGVDEMVTVDGMTLQTETFGIKSESWNGRVRGALWREMERARDGAVPAAGEFAPAIP